MFAKIDASLEHIRIYNRKSATVSMALIHYLHTNVMHLCIVTEREANYHHHPKMIADDYRWWWWWPMMMTIRQHLHKARHWLIQYLDFAAYSRPASACSTVRSTDPDYGSILLDYPSRLVSRTPIYNLSRTAGHHHRMTERWRWWWRWWWWWPGWFSREIACNV